MSFMTSTAVNSSAAQYSEQAAGANVTAKKSPVCQIEVANESNPLKVWLTQSLANTILQSKAEKSFINEPTPQSISTTNHVWVRYNEASSNLRMYVIFDDHVTLFKQDGQAEKLPTQSYAELINKLSNDGIIDLNKKVDYSEWAPQAFKS